MQLQAQTYTLHKSRRHLLKLLNVMLHSKLLIIKCTVFVIIVINTIKNKKFNFLTKLEFDNSLIRNIENLKMYNF